MGPVGTTIVLRINPDRLPDYIRLKKTPSMSIAYHSGKVNKRKKNYLSGWHS